jgi:hypothetical protein
VFRLVRAAVVRVAAIVAVFVVIGRAAPARADNVDTLIRQLGDSGSDKVRLSAALNLTKLGDPRAILPLAKALGNDTEPTVRGAAAVGLGKLVTGKTSPSIKRLVVTSLTQAGNSDQDQVVRDEAQKALQAIGGSGGSTPQPPQPPQPSSSTGCYVNIGPMASKTGDAAADARLKALMVKTANRTMARVASNMTLTWPGGVPTQAMLVAKGTAGFYVDGTVNDVKVQQSGSSMTVSCKISMLIASFPNKSIFGLLNGGASVQSSSAKTDIAGASEDCVSAVVEDLIAKKIVPTITSKAGCP